MNKLLYFVNPNQETLAEICKKIKMHDNIKFVSLLAVDLGYNSTDEKIPISEFLNAPEEFLNNGIQTDGSSVHLPQIASINHAKVDLKPDKSAIWYVDYNLDYRDKQNRPIGTLVIPAFLLHDNKYVCSRSILKQSEEYFQAEIKKLFHQYPQLKKELDLKHDIEEVMLTVATELEFWVRTPDDVVNVAELSTSQSLKEQYWKRTIGPVRKAIEKSLLAMDYYGLEPEMGHKEVGGVHAKFTHSREFNHIMEQLEIDWRFSSALQAADNELFARHLIKDIFMHEGLEVTFNAKPIEGVAGSGEHHHLGASLKTKDGKLHNLFAPLDMKKQYLNRLGYGAFIGILGNYESINPFVASSNDAFKRLKPGFEAPVCIVGSLGHSPESPTRNRTILLALVRDVDNPLATRFELRSPNPKSNSYLLTAACYHAMLDGIKYTLEQNKSIAELHQELTKKSQEDSTYLEKERQYISEEDVFNAFNDKERSELFSAPPFNVFQNLTIATQHRNKRDIFATSSIFSEKILNSYQTTILEQWKKELSNRLIPDTATAIRNCKFADSADHNQLDKERWQEIETLKLQLLKDDVEKLSLFSQIKLATENNDYDLLSELQFKTQAIVIDLLNKYQIYQDNINI